MNNKLIYIFLLLFSVLNSNAQVSDSINAVSLNSFDLIRIINPWLMSSNPAGLVLNPDISPGRMNLAYHGENGDYKRIQQGENIGNYSFQTERYKKKDNTFYFGTFSYDKSLEKGVFYSNINNPYRGTPFLLIDTIGNDEIDREFFTLRGDLATPLFKNINWGFSADLNVGLASQNRDPRPKNKVLNLSLSQGLLFSFSKLNLGLNMLYSYYNEDIEVEIIKENTQMAFFQLHGLDSYTYHVAASFNRLYKRNSMGGEAQINYNSGKINSLFGTRFLYIDETADDGRKAGDASWSYIKNDSELEGISIELYNTTKITNNSSIHSFNVKARINSMLGSEIIQRLEVFGETEAVDWLTYGVEEKYYSSLKDAEFSYSYLKMKEEFLQNYKIHFAANYYSFEQAYYVPDRDDAYENVILSLDLDKSFYLKKNIISLATGIKHKKNLGFSHNYGEGNFITEKLLIPDLNFLSSDFNALSLKLSYERSLNKLFDKYFFNSTIDLYSGENDLNRTIYNFSTGVIF
ncbi:MAG: hypothetical protein K9H49_14130 [Bacteroidales bacterium]|nr:hypothetical protein [Bacteroidales bacterium]MCF8390832.1 hypothetical protein [Bacteroidales bacterium]